MEWYNQMELNTTVVDVESKLNDLTIPVAPVKYCKHVDSGGAAGLSHSIWDIFILQYRENVVVVEKVFVMAIFAVEDLPASKYICWPVFTPHMIGG